jgi:hypothetical protein
MIKYMGNNFRKEENKMNRKKDYESKIKVRGFGCNPITTR